MSNFHSLADTVRSITVGAPNPSIEGVLRPLAKGEFVAAAVVQLRKLTGGLHRQPNHEELLIVLEGDADFRVGDEVRRIRAGDFVFIPRNAPHGTVAGDTRVPLSFLSIMTPEFDLTRDVVWDGDARSPRFRQV